MGSTHPWVIPGPTQLLHGDQPLESPSHTYPARPGDPSTRSYKASQEDTSHAWSLPRRSVRLRKTSRAAPYNLAGSQRESTNTTEQRARRRNPEKHLGLNCQAPLNPGSQQQPIEGLRDDVSAAGLGVDLAVSDPWKEGRDAWMSVMMK
jgi:hypothetical protein